MPQPKDWNRIVRTSGYLAVWFPEHPKAWKQGFVFVHRVVKELEIGRYLERHEHVHHINGDTYDNRLENLQVLTNAEHARLHKLALGKTMSTLTCDYCGNKFERETRQTRKGYTHAFCTRTCMGKYACRARVYRPRKS